MTNTLQIGCLFLAQFAFGSAILMPFYPQKQIGKSYPRFYYGMIVLFAALFLLGLNRLNQLPLNYIILCSFALWIWLVSFTKNWQKFEPALWWFFAFCSLGILFDYPAKFIFHGVAFVSYLPQYLLYLIGAVFLSFHMMNMIFGHWYLTNRELPIQLLIKTCKALLIFTYVRVASVAVATYMAYSNMTVEQFDRLLDFTGHGIFFWARILAGLGIPLLVSHLAYASAKIGSNQSATGIMYAGTIFVIMGEFIGLYLLTLTGVFL